MPKWVARIQHNGHNVDRTWEHQARTELEIETTVEAGLRDFETAVEACLRTGGSRCESQGRQRRW